MERPERPGGPAETGGEIEAWRSGRRAPVEPVPDARRAGPDASSGSGSRPGPSGPVAGGEPDGSAARTALRRFRPRSWKGSIGLGIVGAAVLLSVFLAFDDQARFWVPLAAGFVVLALLALLRLDRLLQGWTWHIAGVALLAGLVYETAGNPWAWAMAASTGVLVAGVLRLPRWQLAAIGVGLFVLSFVGYQFRAAEVRQQEEEVAQQAGTEMRHALGVSRPTLVLVNLDRGIRDADPDAVCRLLEPQAGTQLLQATGAPTCESAVAGLHAAVPAESPKPTESRTSGTQTQPPGTVVPVDGCEGLWGRAAPALGTIDAVRTEASKETWRIIAFRPCPPLA